MSRRMNRNKLFSRTIKQGDCWIWTGYIDPQGYGATSYNSKHIRTHQLAFLFANGNLPSGKEIAHKCSNRACINPDHLYAATRVENARDARVTGAWKDSKTSREREEYNKKRVARFHRAELVRRLRGEGWSLTQVAKVVGLVPSAVSRISSGKICRGTLKLETIPTDALMPSTP